MPGGSRMKLGVCQAQISRYGNSTLSCCCARHFRNLLTCFNVYSDFFVFYMRYNAAINRSKQCNVPKWTTLTSTRMYVRMCVCVCMTWICQTHKTMRHNFNNNNNTVYICLIFEKDKTKYFFRNVARLTLLRPRLRRTLSHSLSFSLPHTHTHTHAQRHTHTPMPVRWATTIFILCVGIFWLTF